MEDGMDEPGIRHNFEEKDFYIPKLQFVLLNISLLPLEYLLPINTNKKIRH